MNNPDSNIPMEDSPAEAESTENPPVESQQQAFQPLDMRRRLRELLSVPERDRSDKVWDEIIELEIQLAPGNRLAGGEPQPGSGVQRHGPIRHGKSASSQAGGANSAPGGGAQQKKHRPRTKSNRRPRQGGKPGGGAGEAA